jgi:hypothetical protein
VREAHLAQGGCGQGRYLPQLAAGENAPRRVWQLLVDAQLDLTAWQQARAGNMAAFVSVALTHIEDDQVLVAGFDARLELGERDERYSGCGLGEQLRDRLPTAHIGTQCLGDMRRHRQVELAHHVDESGAVALLQARVAGDLLADGRALPALVVVRREDSKAGVEFQKALEEAVVESLRIATRQVGAAGSTDQQGVAGEHAVLDLQAHRVAGVAGRVHHLQAQAPEHQHLTVADAHVHEGRGTRSVHHDRHGQLPCQLPGCREMVGVGVGVDQVTDAQAITRGERKVVVDLADFRIDQRCRAGVLAADKIGLAAASGDLFENHCLILLYR